MSKAAILEPIYEKKRQLETEMAALAVSRDTSKRTAEEAAAAVTDLNDTKSRLEILVDGIIGTAHDAIELLKSILTRASSAVNRANEAISMAETLLTALKARIEREEVVLSEILASQKERMGEITRENDKLGQRERDLDIYKSRLQAKYDELGLGELKV